MVDNGFLFALSLLVIVGLNAAIAIDAPAAFGALATGGTALALVGAGVVRWRT